MPLKSLNINEWEKRADRHGLQSVMSTRWTLQQCKNATKKLKTNIFSLLPDLKNKRVLDIGCGIGRFTIDLADKASEVYAIDISSSMLTRAKKNLESRGVKIFKEPAHKLHFSDRFFNLTFEVTVLQHILDEDIFRQTLQEIKRVTNPEGMVLLCGEMAERDKVVSPFTVIRSLETYSQAMKPWKLIKVKNHRCITDRYKIMLWSL